MAYGYSGWGNSQQGSDTMGAQIGPWSRGNAAGEYKSWYEETQGMYRPSPEAFDAPKGVGTVKDYITQGHMQPLDENDYRSRISQGYDLSGTARGTQEDMLGYLKAVAEGNLGGGRKTLSQQAQEQSLSQIQAQSTAAARSGQSAAAQRMAQYTGAAASQQAAASGALASMKEQQDAQRAVLAGAGQMRTQDLQMAGLAQQGLLSATQAESMKKDMTAKYIALGLSEREADRRANMALEAMRMQAWESHQGRDMQRSAADDAMMQSIIGGGIAAGGALLAAFSDKRGKKDIKKADMKKYITSCAGAKTGIAGTTGFLDEVDEPGIEAPPVVTEIAQVKPLAVTPEVSATSVSKSPSKEAIATPKANVDEPGIAVQKVTQAAKTDDSSSKAAKAAGGILSSLGGGLMGGAKESEPKRMADAAASKNYEHMMELFNSLMATPDNSPASAFVSDKAAKASAPVEDFMDALQAYKYRYKNPEKHGAGERVGVMAQDMEKSKLGDALIVKDKQGLRHINMDPQKFNPLVLASLADLNKRLRKVEGE